MLIFNRPCLKVACGSELEGEEKIAIWNLYEENMFKYVYCNIQDITQEANKMLQVR